jgi:ABC-type phosphate/phosphonate transport system ATPase subunit
MSLHWPALAQRYADRVVALRGGRVWHAPDDFDAVSAD